MSGTIYDYQRDIFTAADNHNLFSSQGSWFTGVEDTLKSAAKFTTVSLASGVNSFYNTGEVIGNWISGQKDKELRSTYSWLASYDSDLASYYQENQQWADTAGFLATSLVPGIAGIKALNYGQKALQAASAGKVGTNLARATGLLAPRVEMLRDTAASAMNASAVSTKMLNLNTAKAIGAGFHQQVLEAVAFESFVQASMAQSPLLTDQDGTDIAKNIVVGGLLGGAIGGAFETAKTFGFLRKAVKAEDVNRLPLQQSAAIREGMPADAKIVSLAEDLESTPIPGKDVNTPANTLAAHTNLYQDKQTMVLNEIRTATRGLAKNNEVGNLLADIMSPEILPDNTLAKGFSTGYLRTFAGAVEIAPAKVFTKAEGQTAALLKKLKAGEADIDQISGKLTTSRYYQISGEDAGKVFDSAPPIFHIGDLHESPEKVIAAAGKQGFRVKKTELFNPLKLLEGKVEDALHAMEYRQVWANSTKHIVALPKEMPIHELDIPLLTRAYKEGNIDIKIMADDGTVTLPSSQSDLKAIIEKAKVDLVNKVTSTMLEKDLLKGNLKGKGNMIAAGMADVRYDFLEGTFEGPASAGLWARDTFNIDFKDHLSKRLPASVVSTYQDTLVLPTAIKVVYAAEQGNAITKAGFADAVAYYKSVEKAYAAKADNAAAFVLGQKAEMLPEMTIDADLKTASRVGPGGGLFSFQDGNYGQLTSKVQRIGQVSRELMNSARKDIDAAFAGHANKLLTNPAAGREWIALNQQMSRLAEPHYLFKDNGDAFLVPLKFKKSLEEGTMEFDDVVHSSVAINNKDTAAAVESYMNHTFDQSNKWRTIWSARGKTKTFPEVPTYRPVRPDPAKYPHFSFVLDDSVTGSGHVTMIHAATADKLVQLEDKVRQLGGSYKVVNKADVEAFHKARGDFEYSRSLNDYYLDSELTNKGIYSEFFAKTDPAMFMSDMLNQTYSGSDTLIREAVRLKYEAVFDQLEKFGNTYSRADTSKLGSSVDRLRKVSDNPYYNYIKTALDVSKASESNLIYSANSLLDQAFSRAYRAIGEAFAKTKSPEELESINKVLNTHGLKSAYYDAALDALVNHKAPRGELTKFVREANGLLSAFTLGLDPINALNNAIGSTILRGTELKAVIRAIGEGAEERVGALARINVPGTESTMLAPTKLVKEAISNFWKDARTKGRPLLAKYKSNGLVKDRLEQLALLVDDITLEGSETSIQLGDKVKSAYARGKDLLDKGEAISGNRLAEEFNRFISANVMQQLTDIAVQQGKMTEKEAWTYINTFVNRVEGNMMATQRPGIFQGPIGQAIGLFQSYQFNLMQNLFRHVSEGRGKDVAMMAGLQGTIYGAQSMPGFQWINTHIVGTASGNSSHKDLYDATYGIAGKSLGDLFLYGLPSFVTNTNIYSRGDVNPRSITVLPTNLMDVPAIGGWSKFFGNIYETFGKMAAGGNAWETFLQGVEHNGISRPLAGIAQTLQALPNGTVYSTTNQGSIIASNDLYSLSTLARIAGARPLDEAVVNDELYRIKAYQAADTNKRKMLAETVKTTLIEGGQPTQEQLEEFYSAYAKAGGKQAEFNRWMMSLYKSANVPQSEQLKNSLTSPYAYKMQLLMGGED